MAPSLQLVRCDRVMPSLDFLFHQPTSSFSLMLLHYQCCLMRVLAKGAHASFTYIPLQSLQTDYRASDYWTD